MAAKKRQNKMVHFKGSAFSVQVLGLLYVNYKAGGGGGGEEDLPECLIHLFTVPTF